MIRYYYDPMLQASMPDCWKVIIFISSPIYITTMIVLISVISWMSRVVHDRRCGNCILAYIAYSPFALINSVSIQCNALCRIGSFPRHTNALFWWFCHAQRMSFISQVDCFFFFALWPFFVFMDEHLAIHNGLVADITIFMTVIRCSFELIWSSFPNHNVFK